MDKKISKYPSVINIWTKNIISNKQIVLHDKGKVIRDFVHIDDLCSLFEKIICSPKKYRYEIFNISNGLGIKLKDFLKILLDTIKKDIKKFKKKKKFFMRKYPLIL